MKTFAEYLPTMTAREREIVQAFHLATEEWHECDDPRCDWPLEQMRSTPPAKEPVSVEGVIVWEDAMTLCRHVRIPNHETGTIPVIKRGDRVRVVKIEEVQQ